MLLLAPQLGQPGGHLLPLAANVLQLGLLLLQQLQHQLLLLLGVGRKPVAHAEHQW